MAIIESSQDLVIIIGAVGGLTSRMFCLDEII